MNQIAVRDDIKSVWDILAVKDRSIYLASLTGVRSPVLFDGNAMTTLPVPTGYSLVSCRLFPAEGSIGVEGLCRHDNGRWLSAIWLDGRLCASFTEEEITSLTVDGSGICCTVNPSRKASAGIIYRSEEPFGMPENYSVISASCIKVIDGMLHVGLSSLVGEKPLVWKDGQIDSLNINGFISSIHTEAASVSVFP